MTIRPGEGGFDIFFFSTGLKILNGMICMP